MGDLATTVLDSRLLSSVSTDDGYLKSQRAAYEEKREAEKQIVFNQLTADDYKGPAKNKSARLAAIIARHRMII